MTRLDEFGVEPHRDPEYVRYLRGLCEIRRVACYCCGSRGKGDVVPAHVRTKGAHGDRRNIVFLCYWCHEGNDTSIHKLGSYKLFDEEHGLDCMAEAQRIDDQYVALMEEI